MKTPYPGIDYAGPGSPTNRNLETGIRYGVISCNSVGQSLYDAQEMDYGPPHCPECGTELKEDEMDDECPHCDEEFNTEDYYPDEACGWHIEDGEYVVVDCLTNDAMVIKSPFYTYAQFCSLCVPGAGNLDRPLMKFEGGEIELKAFGDLHRRAAEQAGFPKTYCLGWDWFDEDNPCPYPAIYRVDDDSWVHPKQHEHTEPTKP